MQLTRERQEAARTFIQAHARPLERALYAHFFEDADAIAYTIDSRMPSPLQSSSTPPPGVAMA